MFEITNDATAIRRGDTTWRLKDLLGPARAKQELARRLDAVEAVGNDWVRLVLSNGDRFAVALADPGPTLLVHNIGQLLTLQGEAVGLVENALVFCENGRVTYAGKAEGETAERCLRDPRLPRFDARGGVVSPGLIDPHTHPVFAGQRCEEFDLKAQGKSYLEIHKAGGGIQSTVNATRNASKADLLENCAQRLDRLLGWGVTTIEAKSGYALSVDGELRLLRVLRELDGCHAMDILPTLLGAHTIPAEFKSDREAYLTQVIEEMIPRAAEEKLALFCDAYCEDGAFTTKEVARIFAAAQKHGLGLRLHAEQFTDQGGTVLASQLGAVSVDHLEAISDGSIAALSQSKAVAVLLPGAALNCRSAFPPAQKLFAAGIPVALGTDLNPGSSMTASLPLMMSLACMQMGFSCDQAWRAVTREAARSLSRDDIGHLGEGARADLAVFDAPDYRYIPYHYGENHCSAVIKGGRVVLGEA